MHFAAVLEHSSQPGLLKSELLLHHSKWMLNFCAYVRFSSFDQISHAALRRLRESSPLP